jgi:hypothetical protein
MWKDLQFSAYGMLQDFEAITRLTPILDIRRFADNCMLYLECQEVFRRDIDAEQEMIWSSLLENSNLVS